MRDFNKKKSAQSVDDTWNNANDMRKAADGKIIMKKRGDEKREKKTWVEQR